MGPRHHPREGENRPLGLAISKACLQGLLFSLSDPLTVYEGLVPPEPECYLKPLRPNYLADFTNSFKDPDGY